LQAIALERSGKLISEKYLGIFEHLEWECVKGHRFKAAPNNVKNSGSWCPKCLGRGRNIQDMHAVAVSRGGKCLSEEYINSVTPLQWECHEGHQWNARPNNVFFGTWCPICAKKNRTLRNRKAVEQTPFKNSNRADF
jgi:Zn finger protein HypA/HybF involved in hydrogenase expression